MKFLKHLSLFTLVFFSILFPGYCQENLFQAGGNNSDLSSSYNSYFTKYLPLAYSNAAQDTTEIFHFSTRDGNEFVGSIVEETTTSYKVKTESYGIVEILKVNIKSMEAIKKEKVREGIYWKDHIQSTRYFWQPNGYGLKQGEAYYQNVWVFFNQFGVGLTDNILLGGGIMPLFLLGGTPTPVWVTPKVSFPIVQDKVNVGIGGLFGTVIGAEDTNLGIAYGTVTFGPRDKNLTVGAGWGYTGGDWANRPVFSFSFLSRVGVKGYFIMENYILDIDSSYGVLSMIGGRSILGKSAALDYGLVFPFFPDIGAFIAIPWLGLTIPLANNK